MKTTPETPQNQQHGIELPVLKFASGEAAPDTSSAWLDSGPTWVPSAGEFGVEIGGVWRPVNVTGTAVASGLSIVDNGVRPLVKEPHAIVDATIDNSFPSIVFPEWMMSGPIIAKPQLLSATVLDTEISASNPGLIVASPTLFRFPGVISSDGVVREVEETSYRWRGLVSWVADSKTLVLTMNGLNLQYTTGSGTPDTDYTGPIGISSTTTVHFWATDELGIHSPINAARVVFDGSTPEPSWSQRFPFLAYDPLDPGETAIPSVTMSWNSGSKTFTLTCPVSGATILYSLDGSEPSTTYAGAVGVTDTATVKFKASKSGRVDSDTFTKVLTFLDNQPPDNFSWYAPDYTIYAQWTKSSTSMSLGSWYGGTIYYTLGSGDPDTTYTGPVTISETKTIRFRRGAGSIYSQTITYVDDVPPASFTTAFNTEGGPTPPEEWDVASGIGYVWTYGASAPADPTPQTKTGEAVGTRVVAPWLPDPLVSGILKVRAYRYGWALSEVLQANVTVRIGKVVSEWDGEELTITTPTSGATIKYSTDGSEPSTTYTGPLIVTETTAFAIQASKTGMGSSDVFSFSVIFSGEVPPDPWTKDHFTMLAPTTIARTQMALIPFRRTPTFYCAPGASGAGATPGDPADLWAVLGSAKDAGPAYGSNTITSYYSHGPTPSLSFGKSKSFGKLYYGLGAAPDTVFSSTLYPAANQIFQYHLRSDSGTTVLSQTWMWVRRIGTDDISVTFDPDSNAVTVSGIPDGITCLIDEGTAPVSPYCGAFDAASTTYYVRLRSSVGTTDVKSVTIDAGNPETVLTMTWTNETTNIANNQPAAVIWCAEGEYDWGATADAYINDGVEVYGGFNSSFTVRDRGLYKSYMVPDLSQNTHRQLYLYGGLIDGFTWDITLDNTVMTSSINLINVFNSPYHGNVQWCNFKVRGSSHGAATGANTGDPIYVNAFCGSSAYGCTWDCVTRNLNISSTFNTERWIDASTINVDIEGYQPGGGESYKYSSANFSTGSLRDSVCNVRLRSFVSTQYRGSGVSLGVSSAYPAGLPAMVRSELVADLFADDGRSSTGAWVGVQGSVCESKLDLSAIAGDTIDGGGGLSGATCSVGGRIVDSWLKARSSLGSYPGGGNDARITTYGFVGDNIVDIEAHSTGCTSAYWSDVFLYPYRTQLPRVDNLVEDLGANCHGNPERSGAVGNGLAWYGGSPNGPGAPLEGYETAQGTGTQYGRYWE